MGKIEKYLFVVLFGFCFPILFFLIFISLWFYFYQQLNPVYFAIAGIFTGLAIDITTLKKLVSQLFKLSFKVLFLFDLFYNICIYGFFMGFPLFNLIMGIIAGYYIGKRIVYNQSEKEAEKRQVKVTALYSSLIMFLLCAATSLIAITDKYTPANLQGIFRLPYQVPKVGIILICISGTVFLTTVQYYLTTATSAKTLKYLLK